MVVTLVAGLLLAVVLFVVFRSAQARLVAGSARSCWRPAAATP